MVASWMFVPHSHGLAPSLMFDSSGQHVDLGQICMQGFFGAVSSVAPTRCVFLRLTVNSEVEIAALCVGPVH